MCAIISFDIRLNIKRGDIMDEKKLLLDLEEPLHRLKCAVNAVELMMYGLGRVRDPYADGFFVIWNCLQEAEEDIRKAVQAAGE
jgi:hypothetical protein